MFIKPLGTGEKLKKAFSLFSQCFPSNILAGIIFITLVFSFTGYYGFRSIEAFVDNIFSGGDPFDSLGIVNNLFSNMFYIMLLVYFVNNFFSSIIMSYNYNFYLSGKRSIKEAVFNTLKKSHRIIGLSLLLVFFNISIAFLVMIAFSLTSLLGISFIVVNPGLGLFIIIALLFGSFFLFFLFSMRFHYCLPLLVLDNCPVMASVGRSISISKGNAVNLALVTTVLSVSVFVLFFQFNAQPWMTSLISQFIEMNNDSFWVIYGWSVSILLGLLFSAVWLVSQSITVIYFLDGRNRNEAFYVTQQIRDLEKI